MHANWYVSTWRCTFTVYLSKYVCVQLCEGMIPSEDVEPRVQIKHDRVSFIVPSKRQNISILLSNVTFEDEGTYACFARNPKEKNRNHTARLTLKVVDQSMWQIHKHSNGQEKYYFTQALKHFLCTLTRNFHCYKVFTSWPYLCLFIPKCLSLFLSF